MLKNENSVVLHQGVYKKTATTAEAVFMITGMTIGAGILGIPYMVAQVGLITGLIYIFVLGLVMLFLNLMIGEVAVRTRQSFQLSGLAGKYIGPWAKGIISVIVVFSGSGALLAYVVGEGQTLSMLIGGSPEMWSVIFWSVGSVLVWRGLQTIKKAEKIFSFLVIIIIVGLSFYLLPYTKPANLWYFNPANIFLPFGVILFALHASPAVIEAHALLPHSQRHFRRALVIGTLIPVLVYMLFTLAVVGANGLNTGEVAIAGQSYGTMVLFFSSLFAIFSMGTGFMGLGIALKQTLVWDHKVNPFWATIFVIITPIILFALGLRSFVTILNVVGGLFISIEAIVMVLVYLRARQAGDLGVERYGLRYSWMLVAVVLFVFAGVSLFSISNLLR